MDYKKVLLVTSIVTGLFISIPTEAKTINAKVIKSSVKIDKLIEEGQYDTAENYIKNILKKNPNDINAKSLHIISLAKQKEPSEAQKQLNYYLPKYPNNANLHYAQGLVNIQRQASSNMDYRDNSEELISNALSEFLKAVKLNPKHYQSYNALGVIAINTGNYDKGRSFFYKALEIEPTYSLAIDNLGTIDYLNKDLDEAQKKFMKALKYNPKSATAYFHLAQVYDKKSLYSNALSCLEYSLKLDSNSTFAHNLMGEIYKKQGNEAAAINAFKKSIALKPENPRPYMNMANIYEKRSDAEFAIEQLKTAISSNSEFYDAKLKIADISLVNGTYPQALKYYSSLVGVESYNNEALKGIASTYFEMAKSNAAKGLISSNKDLFNAYENIEKAIGANPNDLELYLAKLKLAKITNQPKQTQETLNKIIEAKVTGLSDIIAKGDAYLAMHQYKEAQQIYKDASDLALSQDEKLYLSEILTYNKFYESAKDNLKKVLEKDVQNEEALSNLNYIYDCEKQSNFYYKDAKYFAKNRNKVFAREYAEHSLEFNPTNFNAAKLSAKLCEKQKHYDSAIEAYKIVTAIETRPRKIKAYNRKIKKLEKKLAKENRKLNGN